MHVLSYIVECEAAFAMVCVESIPPCVDHSQNRLQFRFLREVLHQFANEKTVCRTWNV